MYIISIPHTFFNPSIIEGSASTFMRSNNFPERLSTGNTNSFQNIKNCLKFPTVSDFFVLDPPLGWHLIPSSADCVYVEFGLLFTRKYHHNRSLFVLHLTNSIKR